MKDPTPLAAGTDLQLSVRKTETLASTAAAIPYSIVTAGMDHPGIVQRLVRILRLHDVNIRSLNTHVSKAPLSGAPLFSLDLEADVPAEESIDRLREELTELASKMNLDLNFKN